MELLILAGVFVLLNFVLLLVVLYNAWRIRRLNDELRKR